MTTRRRFLAVLAAMGAAGRASAVRAAAWPERPIKIIMPFAPGGNSDAMGRLIAQHMSEDFGQQVVVDNRPGGMGVVAAEAVARAAPDGYTLLWCALPHVAIIPAMAKVNYDPVKDFAPISNVGTNPFVLVVNPSLPVATLQGFVDYVRSRPDRLAYASGGTGTLTHLSMVLLLKRADLDMIHVPYKGGGPAMADVIAGQVKAYFGNLSEAIPQARAGTVRAIAVSSATRASQLPDVPTVGESGYPGFHTVTWNGLLAPAGTPNEIVDRLAHEVSMAVKDPAVIERLAGYGVDPVGDTPAQFAATIAADIPLWAEAVKIAGVTLP